jgi:hypothetical protein
MRTEADVGDTLTVTATGAVMVTLADPETVGVAAVVAVTETVAGEGTVDGAVYKPVVSTIPTAGFPPEAPLTDQLTDVLVEFCTVAVNCCV